MKCIKFIRVNMKENDEEAKDLIPEEWKRNVKTKRKETDEILKRNRGSKKRKYEITEEEEEEERRNRERKEDVLMRMRLTKKNWVKRMIGKVIQIRIEKIMRCCHERPITGVTSEKLIITQVFT